MRIFRDDRKFIVKGFFSDVIIIMEEIKNKNHNSENDYNYVNYFYDDGGDPKKNAQFYIDEYLKGESVGAHYLPITTLGEISRTYEKKLQEQHKIVKEMSSKADNEQRAFTTAEMLKCWKHQNNEERAREIIELLDKVKRIIDRWED